MFESIERYLSLTRWSYHRGKLCIECNNLVTQKLTGRLFTHLKRYFNYPFEIYINDRLVWERNVACVLGQAGGKKLKLPLVRV